MSSPDSMVLNARAWARRHLPEPVKRPLRAGWARGQDLRSYMRGKWILARYWGHHQAAKRAFVRDGGQSKPIVGSLRHVGVRLAAPWMQDSAIALPPDYPDRVKRVAADVAARFELSENCRLFPEPLEKERPILTQDVPALRRGEVITLQLLDPFAVDGLQELCAPIVEELEHRIYGSWVLVDKVYVYRSPVSRQIPRASWIWHFDNHPYEVLKVMVYLTDVTIGTAPFEYIRQVRSGSPLNGAPIAPYHGHTRVSEDVVQARLQRGYELHSVTGPQGTTLIFDENIVHRASLARDGHRDVVVFQVRPSLFRARPAIGDWTGSFRHLDINRSPWDLTRHAKGSPDGNKTGADDAS